jgi:hypothetical protein
MLSHISDEKIDIVNTNALNPSTIHTALQAATKITAISFPISALYFKTITTYSSQI